VASNDTRTTSPHPHSSDRLRRGPVRVHPRKDQRRWGQTYLRGLLLDGKRKSIEPMATRLARGDPQADAYALEQALQQFVNQSPWDPTAVRRRLAQRMTTALAPDAWVIDDTGFPKFGT
jgi:SRSO17 transposase